MATPAAVVGLQGYSDDEDDDMDGKDGGGDGESVASGGQSVSDLKRPRNPATDDDER